MSSFGLRCVAVRMGGAMGSLRFWARRGGEVGLSLEITAGHGMEAVSVLLLQKGRKRMK